MDNIVRALKVFVIAGGVVLLAGTVLLVVLIMLREPENPAATATPARAESTAAAAPVPPRRCEAAPSVAAPRPEALRVPLPAGAHVEQVVPYEGCLILLGVARGGRQFVAVVDPGSGVRLSLLLLRPQE